MGAEQSSDPIGSLRYHAMWTVMVSHTKFAHFIVLYAYGVNIQVLNNLLGISNTIGMLIVFSIIPSPLPPPWAYEQLSPH